ncbi:MAG TPA: hypothetical protein VJR27_01470 [Candidatus Saccharimonadales bacterium]|nr:hypothetical protein [Candidatus Saccharimonadales bacterium]
MASTETLEVQTAEEIQQPAATLEQESVRETIVAEADVVLGAAHHIPSPLTKLQDLEADWESRGVDPHPRYF